MTKFEKEMEKQIRNENMLSFVGSKNNKLDSKIFEIWNYVYHSVKKQKTSPLINNSYKVLDKDLVLTPENTAINISLYKTIKTEENRFFISIRNTDKSSGLHIKSSTTIIPDKYFVETYNYAKHLRDKFPNAWKANSKKEDLIIKEKEKIVEEKTEWEKQYKNEITNLCNKLKIEVYFVTGSILFSTPFGSWMVDEIAVVNQSNLKLYHKNKFGDVNDWHKQRFKSSDIKEVIRYIYKHDYKRYNISIKNLKTK